MSLDELSKHTETECAENKALRKGTNSKPLTRGTEKEAYPLSSWSKQEG